MKNNVVIALVIFLLMAGSSCSTKVLYTRQIRNNLLENQLKESEVQYYNSGKIVLQRNLSYAETQIARGQIKYENGQYIEEIVIPKSTPGVAVSQGRDFIDVSFEQGENRQLRFKCNPDGVYQITALAWKDNYGQVKYDTTYYYMNTASGKAVLQVEKDYVSKYQKQKRVLKGRTVSSGYE